MDVVGRKYISESVLTKDEDGIWTCVVTLTESRTSDGITWEDAVISVKGLDSVMEAAYNTALQALGNKFTEGLQNGNGTSLLKD